MYMNITATAAVSSAAAATTTTTTTTYNNTIAGGFFGVDSTISSSLSAFRRFQFPSIPPTLLTIRTSSASQSHPLRRRCVASMDSGEIPSLYPLHRCKTIYLVRHAQGIHNVEGDKNYKAYMSPEYFDAHLTPLGWQQVDNLRKHVHSSGLLNRIELVVTSPLLRTMQTAVGVFGGDSYSDRMDVLPLMVSNAGNSERAAISSLNCPPIIAFELCREHLHADLVTRFHGTSFELNPFPPILRPQGVHPCDKRRSISEYQCLFPAIDFSLIESNEDTLWKANVREKKEEVAARGMNFMKWLWTRKEKDIAVVTHSGFLFHTLSAFGNDCHPLVQQEIAKHFANCELRSMVLVDKSTIGSDISTTDYPGKIPSGLDLPSDLADERNLENDKTKRKIF